ncbi:IMPACT family protein [Mesoplasma lactucae]|uniref:Proline dipeptidase n=1 Tax=Mesoplasma lactucae ATCC 49193 TaxID=81460 RepID=A0A291ISG3_9MOLU|nr:YigZ family protein [Mesoplasma lactucae]ATG97646.1 proline dipeptidase [Mesoplasma lactucae ATCC 49193]ATZ19891.1 hypothetical protein MLACT_v1c00660 [Mesoplasma lactucae ATCC 49193]MCL8216754.1 hypothetical protein [Mesoplasma lactucae ATCC 49193]
MQTLKENHVYQTELIIKKSRFITIAKKVSSKEELNDFLDRYSQKEARHNCYAYKIGIDPQTGGYSDDGEPKNTAGMPLFKLIENKDLTNVVVLVIRYFGGIKLGAGGLIRAYTKAGTMVLDEASFHQIEEMWEIKISFDINDIKSVDLFCLKHDLEVIDKEFLEQVSYTLLTDDKDISFDNLNIEVISRKKKYL